MCGDGRRRRSVRASAAAALEERIQQRRRLALAETLVTSGAWWQVVWLMSRVLASETLPAIGPPAAIAEFPPPKHKGRGRNARWHPQVIARWRHGRTARHVARPAAIRPRC